MSVTSLTKHPLFPFIRLLPSGEAVATPIHLSSIATRDGIHGNSGV
jgi:hypothetical protein